MKLAIITYVAQESSKYLADALNANGVKAKVFDMGECNHDAELMHYPNVFSYGCSANVVSKVRYNPRSAILTCVDKVETFKAFKKAGVPTVDYVTDRRKIPAKWQWIVCRESRTGRKAEGYQVVEKGEHLPSWDLFTEYFDHVREYRVVVAFGKAFVYFRKPMKKNGEDWHEFKLQPAGKHEAMVGHALKAAKALKMDYVGFDVLVNSKGECKFLEANSAALMTEEVCSHIVEHFVNQ